MATKNYSTKYRKLKTAYEQKLGKPVADVTWRRVVATLKQYFKFEIEAKNATEIVIFFANFKRKYGNFSGRGEGFQERWKAFKFFYQKDESLTGEEFLLKLSEYLNIDVQNIPRTTRYYWFAKAKLAYNASQTYHSKDLSLVAFVAAKWALNKRSVQMKSASPHLTLTK